MATHVKSDNPHIIDALSQLWQRQWFALEQQRAGAVRGSDPECLHQLRVALRQTRALLKIFTDILPSGEALYFTGEFKWLSAVTGSVRDLDVQLAALRNWSIDRGKLVAIELAPVCTALAEQRDATQRQLAQLLMSRRYEQLASRWLRFVAELPQRSGLPAAASSPTREWVALELAKQCLKLLKKGSVIDHSSSSRALHRLRIRGKRLRYLLEGFESLFDDGKRYRRFVKALKRLQHDLGLYRDNELAIVRIEQLIERFQTTPQTPSPLHDWLRTLQLSMHNARADFDDAFTAFDKVCRKLPH